MAEGEFFFDPLDTEFAPFKSHRDTKVPLVRSSSPELTEELTLGRAVEDGVVCSEVLAHFMGVTHSFVLSLGLPKDAVRFRQHGKGEMAHYARDCWDLEVMTSSGWVEMVGIADRSAFDLTQHAKGSGTDLTALRRFATPVSREVLKVRTDKKVLGQLFRARAKEVEKALEDLGPENIGRAVSGGTIMLALKDGTRVELPSSAVMVEKQRETVQGERFTPHVIEPSFGIDRLMVAVLEHSYREEASSPMKEDGSMEAEDEGPYRVMGFHPSIAPIKCGVFPLLAKDGLPEMACKLAGEMRSLGLNVHYDPSGSIGRRYARMDEVGTPFGLTIDHRTLEDGTVTLRLRDTGEQRRLRSDEAPRKVLELVQGAIRFHGL
jgi:glycyl-tRNA synthetase